MIAKSRKPAKDKCMNSLQNLPTLRISSVSKTYQLYAYLQLPKPTNLRVPSVAKTSQLTCTSRLQHLSIYVYLPSPTSRTHAQASTLRQPYAGALSKDEIQHLRSFREGPPTLVNIAGVNA